jgi:hypothetical protein
MVSSATVSVVFPSLPALSHFSSHVMTHKYHTHFGISSLSQKQNSNRRNETKKTKGLLKFEDFLLLVVM